MCFLMFMCLLCALVISITIASTAVVFAVAVAAFLVLSSGCLITMSPSLTSMQPSQLPLPPQLSSPQSPTLKDRRPSAVIDGTVVVIIFVVVDVVHPPCATDAIVDVNDMARLVCAAPGGSRPDPQRHQCQGT
jgi:hypothetical protein